MNWTYLAALLARWLERFAPAWSSRLLELADRLSATRTQGPPRRSWIYDWAHPEELTDDDPTEELDMQPTPDNLIELDEARAAVEAELEALRDQGFAAVVEAASDGRVTPDEARRHLADISDAVLEGVGRGLDALLVLPEPLEALSDLAIQEAVEAAKGLLSPVVADVVERVRDIATPDIDRIERRAAEARRNGRDKRADRLTEKARELRERQHELLEVRRLHYEALQRARAA